MWGNIQLPTKIQSILAIYPTNQSTVCLTMLPSHNPIGNQLESSPIPTSANSASAGNSVAGPVGSGPSGRKAAEFASCCEVLGPQYMGPTGPTASWKPSFGVFQVGEKKSMPKRTDTDVLYLLFLCRMKCLMGMCQCTVSLLFWQANAACVERHALGSEVVLHGAGAHRIRSTISKKPQTLRWFLESSTSSIGSIFHFPIFTIHHLPPPTPPSFFLVLWCVAARWSHPGMWSLWNVNQQSSRNEVKGPFS